MSKESFHMHRKQYDEGVMTAKSDDQYFTHPQVSKRCVDVVESMFSFDNFDIVLEPSAGDGSFLEMLPKEKRVGVDLVKQHPEVIESSFFNWAPFSMLDLSEKKKVITIGNPPFGKNSNMAIDFFNHAANFSDVIAFIIPRTWRKFSVQSKLNSSFGLYFDASLPYHCFSVDGKPWHRIRCCFQIWAKQNPQADIDQQPDWKNMELKWKT